MTQHAILSVEAHRDLRVRTDRAADLGDNVMTCITVPAEFRQVQNEYPILFRLSPERDSFAAVALFGFENGENLFLSDSGWEARYRPLAMDVQPFLIGRPAGGSGENQAHIDMASPRIAQAESHDEGVRIFDEDGRPTPFMETIVDKLGALDVGYQASADFFAALRRHDLIEPVSIDITLNDGSQNRLVGFHGINEDRLQSLDAAALAELTDADALLPIYMAMASLSNISALVARKNRKLSDG